MRKVRKYLTYSKKKGASAKCNVRYKVDANATTVFPLFFSNFHRRVIGKEANYKPESIFHTLHYEIHSAVSSDMTSL